jgi:ribosome-binding ATPase YchF (GTP1/OBG family)
MKIGLAGYSGSGVTTLLALLSQDVEIVHGHGGPEIRSITVEDPNVKRLAEFFQPKKVTRLKVEIVELGDLRPEEGGGLRKDVLVRSAGLEALALVLRGFSAPMSSQCRPPEELAGELEALMQEFCIADLLPVENRLERLAKEGGLSSREAKLLERVKTELEGGRPIREMGLDREELKTFSGYHFLTLVPLMVVTNLGGACIEGGTFPELARRCAEEGIAYVETPSLAELETLEIPEEERAPFLADLGIAVPARNRFIGELFSLLRIVTFYTVGEKEVRAWAVPEGTNAVRTAGKIHSDMERGFIRVEVISVEECLELGGLNRAREAGKLRIEGKEYMVKNGEIFHVRFNV